MNALPTHALVLSLGSSVEDYLSNVRTHGKNLVTCLMERVDLAACVNQVLGWATSRTDNILCSHPYTPEEKWRVREKRMRSTMLQFLEQLYTMSKICEICSRFNGMYQEPIGPTYDQQ
ncbi:uncharacterized protein LOC131237381 isoform X4 [Magnolia sinica]|uniref:uncharacterized protein LOC131237381 isoform X4 n=1 Tax=Magnolia sinica TaxID=86752 RepID=UPI002659D9C3|nr:uncharacterized protein LOC131237381 isoform X4 [Magnolia sinica]